MKKFITVAALLAAGTAFANAAVVANYDVSSVTDDSLASFTAGGKGGYYGFSFTLPETIEGITAGTQLSLDSITFARGDSGATSLTVSSAYLNVFSSSSPSENSFLGQSATAATVSAVGNGSTNVGAFETVSFSGVTLEAGTTYYVFFSSAQITESYAHTGVAASMRLGQAGDGLTGSDVIYTNAAGTQTQANDRDGNAWLPIYSVSVSAIPEPSAFGLLAGAGALALVAARRRRSK